MILVPVTSIDTIYILMIKLVEPERRIGGKNITATPNVPTFNLICRTYIAYYFLFNILQMDEILQFTGKISQLIEHLLRYGHMSLKVDPCSSTCIDLQHVKLQMKGILLMMETAAEFKSLRFILCEFYI